MQLELAPQARHQTKQEMVYHTLRGAILRCELRPGLRLIANEIAQQLCVSQIPVREALQLLQSEGLVTNVPHSGATVAAISPDSVREVFTLIEGLELVATRVVAEQMTSEWAGALTVEVAAMDAALRDGEFDHWAELNGRFHRRIAHATGMPLLQGLTDRVMDHWDRVRRYFSLSVLHGRVAQAQQEHHAILRAMRDGDITRLETLVKAHNRDAMAAYMDHLTRPAAD
jgi:DNA-binding GntR family transcriptional regulator